MESRPVTVRPPDMINAEAASLVEEGERQGHRFMRRLQEEWENGANRFQGSGEILLSAAVDGRLVAIGGLNVDPYSLADEVGRLRHVYVSVEARRLGIGTMLVSHLIDRAASVFRILRLRTDTDEAAAFYARLGFRRIRDEGATHVLHLRSRSVPDSYLIG